MSSLSQKRSALRPLEKKTPLKRQNISVRFAPSETLVTTVEEPEDLPSTPIMDDPEDEQMVGEDPVYFNWTQRVLTPKELQQLRSAGWGNYLEPKEENMRLAVLMTKNGKNSGRYFLNIGHPDLEIGFATFLDDIKKKPHWWENAKLKKTGDNQKSKLTQSEKLELVQLRHDVIELNQKVKQLASEMQELRSPFLSD